MSEIKIPWRIPWSGLDRSGERIYEEGRNFEIIQSEENEEERTKKRKEDLCERRGATKKNDLRTTGVPGKTWREGQKLMKRDSG